MDFESNPDNYEGEAIVPGLRDQWNDTMVGKFKEVRNNQLLNRYSLSAKEGYYPYNVQKELVDEVGFSATTGLLAVSVEEAAAGNLGILLMIEEKTEIT